MINLLNIPDIIEQLPFSKEEKVDLLVDFYNKCEVMTPFNLLPKKLVIQKNNE